jgi:hypothetical protein
MCDVVGDSGHLIHALSHTGFLLLLFSIWQIKASVEVVTSQTHFHYLLQIDTVEQVIRDCSEIT